jgi:hypothetical protein
MLAVSAMAVSAEEVNVDAVYFHPAANLYIHGETAGASNLVARGLSLFPDDGKLLRLKDLLDQQQEQPEDQQQEDQEQDDQQQQDDDQEQEDQEQEDDQADENGEDTEQQDDPEESPQQAPPQAEEMSRDEAEQLLDAMRQEEQNKRLQLHPVLGAPVKVDKDW